MGAEQGHIRQQTLFPQSEIAVIDAEDWIVYHRGWQVKRPESSISLEMPDVFPSSGVEVESDQTLFSPEDLARTDTFQAYLDASLPYIFGTGLEHLSLDERLSWYAAHDEGLRRIRDEAIGAGSTYAELQEAKWRLTFPLVEFPRRR